MNDPQPEGHMASYIGRRKFLATLGGAAAWPLAARAQQPTMPVVGFLRDATAAGSGFMVDGLRKGLAEAGFVEGRNLAIEYAWTDGRSERLSSLAADLVGRHVSVIVSSALDATYAAKAATSTIPVVFAVNNDPVATKLVPSLNHPGRQSHRRGLFGLRTWSKTAGADARDGAKGCRLRRARTSDLSCLCAVH